MISLLETAPSALAQLGMLGVPLFARCFGVALFAPIFGDAAVSLRMRALWAFALTALVFPIVGSRVPAWAGLPNLILATGVDCARGAVLGLILRVFFNGVLLAGELIGRVGGVSVAGCFDPSVGAEVSAVARFLSWVALATFIASGGAELFLEGFLNGLVAVPPGEGGLNARIIPDITNALAASFALALRIAAPTIVATGATYLAAGVASRIAPSLNATVVAFNCNAALALAVLALTIGVVCRVFQAEIVNLAGRLFGGA